MNYHFKNYFSVIIHKLLGKVIQKFEPVLTVRAKQNVP